MVTAQVDASGIVNPTPEPYGPSRGRGRTLPGSDFGIAAPDHDKAGTGSGGC
jgi:hypothetical protein